MNDLADRLRDAGTDLLDLRGPLVAGEPWPLSAAYGTEPEADWGPREVLAHVNEMLPYWPHQLEAVLAGDPATAVPFGRVATDAGAARADRGRPAAARSATCSTRSPAGSHGAAAFLDGLTPADLERRGAASDPRRAHGRSSRSSASSTGHLEEHVVQLREILARSAPA